MRLTIIIAITICIVVVFVLVFMYEPYQGDTLEIAARQLSKCRQRELFNAFVRYKQETGELPKNLGLLVTRGYVSEVDITSPRTAANSDGEEFEYFPEGYGDPNSVVLSDLRRVKKLGKTKLSDIRIVTLGNGRTIEQVSGFQK